jgi:hypothetical protein
MHRAGIKGPARQPAGPRPRHQTPTAGDLVSRKFTRPAPDQLWVTDFERHERSRTEWRWETFIAGPSQRPGCSWGQRDLGDAGEGGSTPDNDEAGQYCQMARARNQRLNAPQESHQLEPGGYGLGSSAHPRRQGFGRVGQRTPGLGDVAGQEAAVKVCGVTAAMFQGHTWAPVPSNGSRVNVGTIPVVPELYRSPVGRRLSRGPLCGPKKAPGLKKALFGSEGWASFPTSGHAFLSLLDTGSAGLDAVLTALGPSPDLRRRDSRRLFMPGMERARRRGPHRGPG